MPDLLLLSGGIDSTALAAWLRPAVCLTVNYGQRAAAAEAASARQVCLDLGLTHQVIEVNIAQLGSGDMAGKGVSTHSEHSEFWPYRNQFLITLGAMVAIQKGCDRVLVGTVVTDKRHADGSPEFTESISELLSLQEGQLRVAAPAALLTTTELIKCSQIEPRTLAWAHSCHVGNLACGRCRGCQKHSEVMSEIGWSR